MGRERREIEDAEWVGVDNEDHGKQEKVRVRIIEQKLTVRQKNTHRCGIASNYDDEEIRKFCIETENLTKKTSMFDILIALITTILNICTTVVLISFCGSEARPIFT